MNHASTAVEKLTIITGEINEQSWRRRSSDSPAEPGGALLMILNAGFNVLDR